MIRITEQMNDEAFAQLPDEEAKRLGAIRERKDLLETRVIRLNPDKEAEKRDKTVLTVMRDPGNTAGLLRVVNKMLKDGYTVEVLADGRGLEAVRKAHGDRVVELFRDESPLSAQQLNPDVLLLTHTTSEEGLENFSSATLEFPIVFIEDMYGAATEFIVRMKERKGMAGVLSRFKKICVSDKYAYDSIVKKYPELKDVLLITGQPLYDRLYGEPRTEMRKKVRDSLGIADEVKLVSFFGASSTDDLPQTPNSKIALEYIVRQLRQWTGQKIRFIFRNHPRDLVRPEQYEKIVAELGEMGVPLSESNKFGVDEVNAATDVVISLPFSTIT